MNAKTFIIQLFFNEHVAFKRFLSFWKVQKIDLEIMKK